MFAIIVHNLSLQFVIRKLDGRRLPIGKSIPRISAVRAGAGHSHCAPTEAVQRSRLRKVYA